MKKITIYRSDDSWVDDAGTLYDKQETDQAIKEAIEKVKGLEITFSAKEGQKYFCQSHVIEILEGIIK